jgi:hypothetical protein
MEPTSTSVLARPDRIQLRGCHTDRIAIEGVDIAFVAGGA